MSSVIIPIAGEREKEEMRIIAIPAHHWGILKPAEFYGGSEDQCVMVSSFKGPLFRLVYYNALTIANGRLALLRIQKAHQEIERLIEAALESRGENPEDVIVVTHPVMSFEEAYVYLRPNFLSEQMQKKLGNSHVLCISHFEDGLAVFLERRTDHCQPLSAVSLSSDSMPPPFQEALDQATRTLLVAASQ